MKKSWKEEMEREKKAEGMERKIGKEGCLLRKPEEKSWGGGMEREKDWR